MMCRSQAGGSYLLKIRLRRSVVVNLGALGEHMLRAGLYVYVGSARKGIAARVDRHRRLALTKSGRTHWHIDYVLIHPESRLVGIVEMPGGSECELSADISRRPGSSVVVPGFGASDCSSGCPAHFYWIGRPRAAMPSCR